MIDATATPVATGPTVATGLLQPLARLMQLAQVMPLTGVACLLRLGWCRPAAAAAAASSNVFEQTRQALGERGEKLARLQDKSAAIESDAANFAAMAKQLADHQKPTKWWQF